MVVGGGVAGVCTAFQLARRGFRVTVLEASHDVSTECSAAAAGSLQRAPLRIDSSVWRMAFLSWLPAWTRRALMSAEDWQANGPSNFTFCHVKPGALADVHFLRWFSRFARHSILEPVEVQQARQQNLSAFLGWSVDRMQHVLSRYPSLASDGNYSSAGLLRLSFGTQRTQHHASAEVASASAMLPAQASLSPSTSTSTSSSPSPSPSASQAVSSPAFITRDRLLEMEPWLRGQQGAGLEALRGADFHEEAASAHCQRFTRSLAEICRKELGVRLAFNTRLEGFETTSEPDCADTLAALEPRVTALITSNGKIVLGEDDLVVMAAGVWNSHLLQELGEGFFLPEYGLKGYTLLLDVPDPERRPKHVIVDPRTHIYMTAFENQVRISGIGEFGGWESKGDTKVLQSLRDKAKEIAPHLAAEIDSAKAVVGMRPFVANGTLLLGRMHAYK